jgi:hypothetical protein
MICYENKTYNLERRKAQAGELVQTTIYIDEVRPEGTVMKVLKYSPKLDEIIVCPVWYEEGMKCFGIKVFLEHNDYMVLSETH